jgi:hypothetical protein
VTVGAERRCRRAFEGGDDYRQPRTPPDLIVDSSADSSAAGFAAFVSATFLFGWVSGLLLVLKSWHLFHATRWLMVSGAGYVTLMLIPIMCGFACARIAGHLVRRGWSGAPLRVLALGVCGLVAGVMAI